MRILNVSIFLCILLVGSNYAETPEELAKEISDVMLLSGKMWRDTENYGTKFDLEYQDKYNEDSTTKYDKFIESIDDESTILKDPTIVALDNLFDTYNADLEDPEKLKEVGEFVKVIWDTKPMKILRDYVVDNRTLFKDDDAFKSNFTDIWFTGFLNATHGKNSSGFQHVFMGEREDKEAHGFHNWVRYYNEEKDNRLTYKGWTEKSVMGEEVPIVSLSFDWEGAIKPVSTIAFGTKPEYEMAILTLCFYMLPGDECYVAMMDVITRVVTEPYEDYVHTAYFTVTQPNASGVLRPDFMLSMILAFFLSMKYLVL